MLLKAFVLLLGFAGTTLWGCSEPPRTARVPLSLVPSVNAAGSGSDPIESRQFQRPLIRSARATWGASAPVALFAAQVHAESSWNSAARSPVGALGLAQFMPATADWIDDAYPDLGPNQPANPDWALRALTRYDLHLYERVHSVDDCNRHAFMLAAYNGGLKWVERDQALAGQQGLEALRYWGSVEQVNAGRSAAAWKENRGYAPRIIYKLQARYLSWGGSVCL